MLWAIFFVNHAATILFSLAEWCWQHVAPWLARSGGTWSSRPEGTPAPEDPLDRAMARLFATYLFVGGLGCLRYVGCDSIWGLEAPVRTFGTRATPGLWAAVLSVERQLISMIPYAVPQLWMSPWMRLKILAGWYLLILMQEAHRAYHRQYAKSTLRDNPVEVVLRGLILSAGAAAIAKLTTDNALYLLNRLRSL